MYLETIRDYCLSLPFTDESMPFDDTTLVFKVKNKMFALVSIPNCESINLKCDPDLAIDLREKYEEVEPGYHMNKKHWNSIALDGSLKWPLIQEWIKNSYDLIVRSLPKREQFDML
jgi:predicted DNA-binding protein (MmcQ/YjbR family)